MNQVKFPIDARICKIFFSKSQPESNNKNILFNEKEFDSDPEV